MKFSTKWAALAGWAALAALLFAAPAVNAQDAPADVRAPYAAVSDFDGPYAAMPPEAAVPGYGYGPSLLPATEVYTVLRENGFLPLGIPRLRGNVYTIAVINRRGDDGRLVIDARDGRIVRFLPARGIGPAFDGDARGSYGPQGALPPPTVSRAAVPRPPASIPHVASRTVPVPKPSPLVAKPSPAPAATAAVTPAPAAAQQATAPAPATAAVTPPVAAAAQPKPAEAQATVQAAAPAPTVVQAPPAPAPPPAPAASAILPTQEMPKVQALE
jgi:hypothetical protein